MNEKINDKFKCGCSKENCRKELAECQEWEVNKKKQVKRSTVRK